MYKKRKGTSGIRGQLYETKLISLIHYRTKFDDDIEDYTLASNVSDIGTFDDICIRATVKVKGENRPVAVFIQAKHREGNNIKLTLNRKRDLAKWFSSYLSIRHLFKPDNEDVLFKGNFHKLECLFIIYTTAKADHDTKEFKSDFADKLNSWIGTGDKGLQPCHKEEDIMFLCENITKEQFAALAVQLAKFLSGNAKDNGPIMPMSDELMLVYHVILVQKVLDVSEIKCKYEKDEHRVASFQADFFTNVDKFIILFKDTLFIEMLRKRQLKEAELNTFLTKLFIKPLDITVLSSLIGNVVMFNDKKFKLEFVSKSMSEDLRRQLEKVNVLQSQVNEAIELGAVDMLKKRQFKVPTTFGNKDMTIRGKEDNVKPSVFIASVINNLKNKLVYLIKESPTENNIVIDESMEKEFLNLNAGLAGTVGNILVSSENHKYMKFADKGVSGDLAKMLYSEVQYVMPNLHDYKFYIKVKTFPKLTFDCDDDENVEMLKYQVTKLAEHMGQFLCKEDDSILPMNHVMSRYHVLVALKALEVSEIQSLHEDDEHRLASFRKDFFESDEEFVILFKRALYNEIFKIRKLDINASDLVAKHLLTLSQFKVPTAFGNKDITIKIKKSKIERRLDHLKLKISELVTKSGSDKIVTIDESLGDGLLKLNGGIAGIVGNLLIAEENTKLMKFTDKSESLGELSKRLFMKLQSSIENLHEYRFNAKSKKIPKLSLKRNEDDENLAKDFLKKLLFFSSQADEQRVEKCLKDEIEDQQCLKVYNVRVTVDAVFQQYHKLIQSWWMLEEASYLTRQSKHYEDALALIVDKPIMSIISLIYMTKIKNNLDYTFNEKALSCLKLKDQPSATIFVTESSALTIAKMAQSLKKTDHFVFNLEYIFDLQANDYKNVTIELSKTNKNQLILIVCNNINRNWMKKLKDIVKLLENKWTIFVLKENLVAIIQTYFVQANNVIIDAKSSLIQMCKKSQKSILENAKVIFQDVELSLDSIIDETSIGFVEGEVLNKVMNNEPINLGETNSNSNYEKVKHLYIDRFVSWTSVSKDDTAICYTAQSEYVRTLNNIPDDGTVAVVIATPGMGKSTLLTHLSLKTKELNPTVWILRINLLKHCDKFSRWQENKTNIGYYETLKFFCEVLTEKQRRKNDFAFELGESNGVVILKSCTGDQWTVFELKMFLDYYNRKEMILLFDGFDEICPTYADEAFNLLTTVRTHPQKHKMWITSRPYDNVISRMEKVFGNSYRKFKLENFSDIEKNVFMVNFWKANIILRDLTKKQYDNLCSFIEFMNTEYTFDNIQSQAYEHLFLIVYLNFLDHLREEISACPDFVVKTCDKLYRNYNYEVKFYVENFSTPLHLHLFAEYFENRIKDEGIVTNRWSLNINAYTLYESFIETILKRRFEEKNKIDLRNPDNRNLYEDARLEFLTKHKKLGTYALFEGGSNPLKIFLSGKELIEIKETIYKIKEGKEKSGFIHSVDRGKPNFIHRTFAEYFAAQHIYDLLKTGYRKDELESVWDCILNVVFRYYPVVGDFLFYKIKSDPRAIVKNHEQIIFDLLLEQGKEVFTHYTDDFRKYLYLNIKTSQLEVLDSEFGRFLDRMLNLIRAITGIVGNLLIAENNTKLMKFTDNWESLGELSKKLFIKLQTGIKNLNKFDAKVKKFPKLSFQRDLKNSVKDLLKKLLFSTNQPDDTGVEFLKHEIDDLQYAKLDKNRVAAYTIILQFLNLIKRWWRLSEQIRYRSKYYENLNSRPYFEDFYSGSPIKTREKTKISCLKLKDQPSALIFVAQNTVPTILEIEHSLKDIPSKSIELEYFLNVSSKWFLEPRPIRKDNEIIIFYNLEEQTWINHLELFAKLLEDQRNIFVIEENLAETIQIYFKQAKKEYSLIQTNDKSHKFILDSARVMLEDLEMCLDSIIDEQEEGEYEVLNTNPN